MKKIALLFLVFSFSFFTLFAQHDSTKVKARPFAELDAGLGVAPRAVFLPSSSQYWMDYVKPGFALSVTGGMPLFHSHFGIIASYTLYYNSFNMTKYLGAVSAGNTSVSVTSAGYGNFLQNNIGVGAFASYTFGKMVFALRALGGIDIVALPNSAWNGAYPAPYNYTVSVTDVYSSKIAFSFSSDITATYKLNTNLGAVLNVGITDALVPYTDTEYNQPAIGKLYTKSYSDNAAIFMAHALLGISHYFK